MNLLTPGVMSGLIGASSLIQASNASMAIYSKEAAKLNPDMEMMGRALGYVNSAMASARIESSKAGEELEAAQAKEKAKEKAEQEAKLQKELADKARAQQEYARKPVDVEKVEISEEGQYVLRSSAAASAQQAYGMDSAPIDVKAGAALEPQIYTSAGTAQAVAVEVPATISVSV